jgi:hypothetical protein
MESYSGFSTASRIIDGNPASFKRSKTPSIERRYDQRARRAALLWTRERWRPAKDLRYDRMEGRTAIA